MSEEITLTETGKGPIKFMGETVCVVSTFEQEGPKSGRWWKVGVYTKDGEGGYWVGIGALTSWDGERHHYNRFRIPNEKPIFKLIDQYVVDDPARNITDAATDRETLKIKLREKLDERVGNQVESQPL